MDQSDTVKAKQKALQRERVQETVFQIMEQAERDKHTGAVIVMLNFNQGGFSNLKTGQVEWN